LIASTVVFARLLIAIAVVAPEFLGQTAGPLGVMALLTGLPSLIIWYRLRHAQAPMPEQANPTQLKSAVFFGLMYTVALVALAAVQQYAAGGYLYLVAGLSGLTDMDAITLSTARLARAGDATILAEGWRMIIVASMANLAFKAAVVGLMANRRLLVEIVLLFLVPVAGGTAMLLLW
jgi:uncharacterized membrane protein (DUF4010 family)